MLFLAQASPENPDTPDTNTANAAQTAADTADAAAETAANAVDAEPGFIAQFFDSGALGLLLEGGFFMWPILILGIVAIAVIIERYRSLKMLNNDDEGLRQQVLDLLTQDRVEDAMNLCDSQRGPVAAVLANGLRKYLVLRRLGHDPAKIQEQVIQSMESYSVHIVAALERHLPILATISSVAPMIGFLGTVQGMIVSFANIVEMMGEVNIVEAAAGGIQVALLTTCFGLIVGIPAFLGFNYFSSIINRFVLEVESTATELVEVVTLQMTLAQSEARKEEASTS
jgi:biopolymer transport protein ExbB